jgi:hypothetical protein
VLSSKETYELEPEQNSTLREEIKPDLSDKEPLAAMIISKLKWLTPYMYIGEGKEKDSQ